VIGSRSSRASPIETERSIELLAEISTKLDAIVARLECHRDQPPPPLDDALLGPREVAKILGLDPRTLRRVRASGHFPAPTTVAGRLRWKRGDVDAWLAARGHP